MGIPESYVLTPHGLVHENCIGAAQDGRACPPLKSIKDLFARTPGGWIESATYTPPVPLGSLSARLKVPRPPATPDQSLIYLFPGAQNARMSTILQPVLQWGSNGRFGGEFWTIASWWCTPCGRTYHSIEHPRVEPDETLLASINVLGELGEESANWEIVIASEIDPTKSVSLTAPGVKDLMLFIAAGALEVYSVPDDATTPPALTHDRSFFPADTSTFSDIKLLDLNGQPFYADWVVRSPENDSGLKVDVATGGSAVTLMY